MRVEVDGQHFDVPDDATPDEIDAITKPSVMAPRDAHSTFEKIAHYGAKALPMAGGIAGGIMGAGAGGGLASIATGAAGAGLLSAAGRSGQHAIDQALGYEPPMSIMQGGKDALATGAQDAAATAAGGMALETAAKIAPRAADILLGAARATEKRVLSNVGGSISVKKPLSDAAVDEASARGVFKFGSSSHGTAERLDAAREAAGDQYAQVLGELGKHGVTGPDAQKLADQYFAAKATGAPHTMSGAVDQVYQSAGDRLMSLVKPSQEVAIPGVPPQPSAGATPLGQRTVFSLPPGELPPAAGGALPRGQKDVFTSLPPTLTLRAGTAHEMAGLPVQKDFPGLFPSGQKDVFALPPPQEAAQIAGAIMKGPIDTFALPPPGANGIPSQTAFIPADNRLSLTQAEDLKRSLQGMAKSAYKQMQPGEVGRAHENAASMMRQAVEDEIAKQTAGATGSVADAAAQFVPVKQSLGNLIEASGVAREGAARAAKRDFVSMYDIAAALKEGPAAGIGMHILRSRGPSSLAVSERAGEQLLRALGPAMSQRAPVGGVVAGALASDRPQLGDILREMLRNHSAAPQYADNQ